MELKIEDKGKEFKDEYIVIAIDSTGIKVTNRDQWMDEKWNVQNNDKKGYLKIHIAVDVKTKKILSIQVTDERVHESKALPDLVNGVMKSDKRITVDKLFADGAYDGNKIFNCLSDNGILSIIKLRNNSSVRWKKETSLETYLF